MATIGPGAALTGAGVGSLRGDGLGTLDERSNVTDGGAISAAYKACPLPCGANSTASDAAIARSRLSASSGSDAVFD
jgi:hypothetical protein